MDRRKFLNRSIHSSLLLGLASLELTGCKSAPVYAPPPSTKGTIILGIEGNGSYSLIRLLNWDTFQYEEFSIPLVRPHAIARSTINPDEYYVWELNGSLLKINSKTSEKVLIDYNKASTRHLGHGIISPDGQKIFSTEATHDYRHHKVVCRASDSLEVIDEKTGYTVLHHIVRMPGSSKIAFPDMKFAGGSTTSTLNFYDIESKESHEVIMGKEHPIHLTPISKEDLMAITIPERLDSTNKIKFNPNEATQYLNSLDAFHNYLVETMPEQNSGLYKINVNGTASRLDDHLYSGHLWGGFVMANLPVSKRYLSSYVLSNNVVLWKDGIPEHTFDTFHPTSLLASKDETELAILSLDKSVSFYSLVDFKLIRKLDPSTKTLLINIYS